MSQPDRTLAAESQNLTLSYGRNLVLSEVSLQVPVGVMGAIVGPNGAGKSTLLKALLGLDGGHDGSTYLLGQPTLKTRHLVGYVPQRSSVDWDFPANVLDVVLMGLYRKVGVFGRVGRQAHALARTALEEVGMADFEKRQIGQLSGGQQQRVFLARALVQQADLYILDEPFAGVDAASEAALVSALRRLNSAGATVLAVHHDLNTLPMYFDWLALLNVRLFGQGPLASILTPEALQAAYGGRLPALSTAFAAASGGAAYSRPPVSAS